MGKDHGNLTIMRAYRQQTGSVQSTALPGLLSACLKENRQENVWVAGSRCWFIRIAGPVWARDFDIEAGFVPLTQKIRGLFLPVQVLVGLDAASIPDKQFANHRLSSGSLRIVRGKVIPVRQVLWGETAKPCPVGANDVVVRVKEHCADLRFAMAFAALPCYRNAPNRSMPRKTRSPSSPPSTEGGKGTVVHEPSAHPRTMKIEGLTVHRPRRCPSISTEFSRGFCA